MGPKKPKPAAGQQKLLFSKPKSAASANEADDLSTSMTTSQYLPVIILLHLKVL